MAYTTVDDGSAHFQGLAYRGNSTSTTTSDRNLTNEGNSDLQPDLVWIANRDTSVNSGMRWWDSNRGVGGDLGITSSNTYAAGTPNDPEYGYVNTLNTDGFGVRAGANDSNGRWTVDRGEGGGDKYIAWQWKANGGTTSSNTDGTITSTVQANTTAGFSIVTFTGDGNNDATIGHGLGVTPAMIITKNVTDSVSWRVYHKDLTSTYSLFINSNNGQTSPTGHSNGYIKTVGSSTYSVYQGNTDTNGVNGSGDAMVSYCFAEKQGYSKCGKYKGSGINPGAFAFTGFKPAFLMVKRIDSGGNWLVYDGQRSVYNLNDPYVYANSTSAEATSATQGYDFLSNGFKVYNTYADGNVDGGTYVYIAFAENPFVTSTGIPQTAR